MAGLILDKKNFFWEFKAPKLKPMKPDNGIQGVRILNWLLAIDLASELKLGANNSINKLELKYINIAKPINNIESFMLT